VSVLSTTYLWYETELVLVRGANDETHISVWGTADGAGASRQAEVSDLDISIRHLVDDGTYATLAPPPVTVWR
jgi:hypothetical protein